MLVHRRALGDGIGVCGVLSFGQALVMLSRGDGQVSQDFTMDARRARAIGLALIAAADATETAQEARAVADLLADVA